MLPGVERAIMRMAEFVVHLPRLIDAMQELTKELKRYNDREPLVIPNGEAHVEEKPNVGR